MAALIIARMEPEVRAAMLAFVGVAVTVAITAYLSLRQIRSQHQRELLVSALEHMVGGSQSRAVGIAALRMLMDTNSKDSDKGGAERPHDSVRFVSKRWLKEYGRGVAHLLYTQMVYLLVHGGNRGQSHEVANVIAMGELLFSEPLVRYLNELQRGHLAVSMQSYLDRETSVPSNIVPVLEKSERGRKSDDKPPEDHPQSVYLLKNTITRNWERFRGPSSLNDNTWFEAPESPGG